MYRLLFLFAAEDRGLLLLPSADEKTRKQFAHYFSTARLRHLAERHRGTRHCDLYQGLAVVMQKLGTPGGCPELGLPALGSFLWSDRAMPDLFPSPSGRGAGGEGACRIANTDFMEAIRALAFTVDGNVLRPVDYKTLGPKNSAASTCLSWNCTPRSTLTPPPLSLTWPLATNARRPVATTRLPAS